jgi:predicted Zn-dependent protease
MRSLLPALKGPLRAMAWVGLIGCTVLIRCPGLMASTTNPALAGQDGDSIACPTARQIAALPLEGPRPEPPPADGRGLDYRHRLRSTPAGWPVRDHWCLWIEPEQAPAGTAASQREQHWRQAVLAGLKPWQALLGVTLVNDPERAQVRVWRRQPPLQRQGPGPGRPRASSGRAILGLLVVERGTGWQAEPRVEVLISPGRPPLAMQATALHELGHAFGLWGHSDRPGDALASLPGGTPLVELSPRDRATLLWLLRQSDRLQTPAAPPQSPATGR